MIIRGQGRKVDGYNFLFLLFYFFNFVKSSRRRAQYRRRLQRATAHFDNPVCVDFLGESRRLSVCVKHGKGEHVWLIVEDVGEQVYVASMEKGVYVCMTLKAVGE